MPNPYTLNFPQGVETSTDKYTFCYRTQELLRLQYNDMGEKYQTGEINKATWDKFCLEWEEKSECTTEQLLYYRNLAKNNNSWDPTNVDDLFTK